MTTQEENELICERLLGWQRRPGGERFPWITATHWKSTPPFDDWASAGLILDAMQADDLHVSTISHPDGWTYVRIGLGPTTRGNTGPAAIRAAALAYLAAT